MDAYLYPGEQRVPLLISPIIGCEVLQRGQELVRVQGHHTVIMIACAQDLTESDAGLRHEYIFMNACQVNQRLQHQYDAMQHAGCEGIAQGGKAIGCEGHAQHLDDD